MRNYEQELENRVAFIRQLLKESGCEGIVYGNSGGKDSALVGILCKKACGNTVGILLPCATTQNYGSDTDDAIRVAERIDGFRTTLDKALAVHSALVARRQTEVNLQQNEQVKKISSWAAIIFAPTLIGTVYGMNFDVMPELHWEYGYPVALSVMVAFPTVLYLIFKRRHWL